MLLRVFTPPFIGVHALWDGASHMWRGTHGDRGMVILVSLPGHTRFNPGSTHGKPVDRKRYISQQY